MAFEYRRRCSAPMHRLRPCRTPPDPKRGTWSESGTRKFKIQRKLCAHPLTFSRAAKEGSGTCCERQGRLQFIYRCRIQSLECYHIYKSQYKSLGDGRSSVALGFRFRHTRTRAAGSWNSSCELTCGLVKDAKGLCCESSLAEIQIPGR
jgi:hypothetical protein